MRARPLGRMSVKAHGVPVYENMRIVVFRESYFYVSIFQ